MFVLAVAGGNNKRVVEIFWVADHLRQLPWEHLKTLTEFGATLYLR